MGSLTFLRVITHCMNFHDYKDQHNWINEVYPDISFSAGKTTSTHQVTKTSTSYTLSHKILAQVFSQTLLSCWKTTTSIFLSGISPIHIDFFMSGNCIFVSFQAEFLFSWLQRPFFWGGTNDSACLNLHFKCSWLLEWAKPSRKNPYSWRHIHSRWIHNGGFLE